MPSVGMRRSTRVFVPKSVLKDAGGATVLRSGKRLWPLSDDPKKNRGNEDEWFPMLESSSGVPCYKSNGWRKVVLKNDVPLKKLRKKVASSQSKSSENAALADQKRDKMYGNGYGRKRSRFPENRLASSSIEDSVLDDRKYGIKFVRKHRRKTSAGSSLTQFSVGTAISKVESELLDLAGNPSYSELRNGSLDCVSRPILDVIVEPSHCCSRRFTSFIVSLLNFMRRSRVRVSKLAAFMCSEPIVQVFSQHGIHFFSDLSCRKNNIFVSRVCKVWDAKEFVPLFSLNFSAVPLSFMSLHFRMFLRSQHLLDVLVRYLMGLPMKSQGVKGGRKSLACISTEMGLSLSKIMAAINSSVKRRGMKFVDRALPLEGRITSIRHNSNSRNIKKRTSLRSRRVKSPSMQYLQKGGVDVADMFDIGNGCSSFSIMESDNRQKKPFRSDLCSNNIIKEPNQCVDLMCCSANILVIKSDRCYREEGAKIMLESSTSNEWYLAVKTQGLTRYMHKAEDVMRPSTPNRFTHAMIWTGRNGWKLEFSDRRDWFNFKELHRECVDRNMQAASAREVPVPGVHEVPGNGDIKQVQFVRPNAYIKMKDDEVARVLMRKTANYDIDSGDEEFLEKLNKDLCSGDDVPLRHVSDENFEEIIDVFEKAAYCTPDDVSDESRATKLCSDLRTGIVTAVYQYWVEKRKQKNSALLRVFQCAPPRRTLVLQKPFLRKRRSFKRQGSKYGKGKPRTFFQVFAEEQEQDAMRRVQEAKNSASMSVELAVLKRKKAQQLMETADLATYKATLALKIAEAVQHAVSSEDLVSFILG
ncbi:Enhancer of polycomb-like [Macleaya cordata]|uniref:Enhancer of polycomb-like protein n=1 Tax=Macleaya cordata TaxID=56857 RepID=A0A200Q6E3_MACCD|nr:Enhancer of polycomb-like [Macleaya cordata]